MSSGGGDVINCNHQPTLFSLDYVVEKADLGRHLHLNSVDSTEQSLSRISNLLKLKLPHLSSSFEKFRRHLDNHSDYSKPYTWNIEFFNLPHLDDEGVERIPNFCSFPYGYDVRQAVIPNKYSNGLVIFRVNRDVFLSLDPVQKSFLLIHEWLWDVSDNVANNRKLNYFLHSTLFSSLSAKQIQSKLIELGLSRYNGN